MSAGPTHAAPDAAQRPRATPAPTHTTINAASASAAVQGRASANVAQMHRPRRRRRLVGFPATEARQRRPPSATDEAHACSPRRRASSSPADRCGTRAEDRPPPAGRRAGGVEQRAGRADDRDRQRSRRGPPRPSAAASRALRPHRAPSDPPRSRRATTMRLPARPAARGRERRPRRRGGRRRVRAIVGVRGDADAHGDAAIARRAMTVDGRAQLSASASPRSTPSPRRPRAR